MKSYVGILIVVFTTLMGILLLTQCTETPKEETAEKKRSELKQEFADAKEELKEAFTPNEDKSPRELKDEFKDVNEELKEAFEAVGEQIDRKWSELEKTQALRKMERAANKLEKRIDDLEDKAEKAGKQKEIKDEMKNVRNLHKQLLAKMDEVEKAGSENWNEVRKETRSAYGNAKKEIKQDLEKIEDLLAQD